MSIIALLAPVLFDVIEMTRPPMVCAFPGGEAPGLPTEVRVVDPQLDMTENGQFKIAIHFGTEALHGRVVPYDKSEARDVVMRARGVARRSTSSHCATTEPRSCVTSRGGGRGNHDVAGIVHRIPGASRPVARLLGGRGGPTWRCRVGPMPLPVPEWRLDVAILRDGKKTL
jgi:hypothetical protein